jgi:hypothetical protein
MPETVDIKVRRFDPSTMRANATVLMSGKRGTGKTTLINDIMYHNRDKFRFGVGMSPTDDTTDALGAFIPNSCVYDEFDEGALQRMLTVQKKAGRGPPEKFHNVFCVLDDCAFDKKTFSNKAIREVFMNGRHRKIFIINSIQYVMDMPAGLRGQFDYVFATRNDNHDEKEKLWKYFFGMFPSFRSFEKVLEECTDEYSVIVFDGTVRSKNVEDKIFHYTADPGLPSFRMCDDIFWKLDEYYFSEEGEEHGAGRESSGSKSEIVVRMM